MKKMILFCAAVILSLSLFAELGPVVPNNTLKVWASQILGIVKTETTALSKRVDVLELAIPSTTKVIETKGSADFNDPTKDAVLTGVITNGSLVKAKSVKMTDVSGTIPVKSTGNALEINAGVIELHSSSFAGKTQQSSNLINGKEVEEMVIEGVTFSGDTYNTIMTGQQTTKFLKTLTIKNCKFEENCKHFNIWFSGFQDGAVLNIENCFFKTCEQMLCIGDFQGRGVTNNLTVNLSNITIQNYEIDNTAYCGFLICDDRFCTSEAQFRESNPFSHVTINIKNVMAKNKKITASNFVMGSGDQSQMLYIYSKFGGGVYRMSDANRGLFPTINFVE